MSLEWRKRAALAVEAKRGHRGIELIGDEHQRQRWMEGDVARARARAHDSIAALDVTQRFAVEIETVHVHPVDAEVRGEREAVGGIGKNAVGMRCFLTLGIRSFSRMLIYVRGSGECSILLDREHRDTSTDIVGDEHHSSAAIHTYVAGRPTFRRLLVQSGERAAISGDREGAHRTGWFSIVLLELVDGVENASVRVDGEERRVRAGIHRADSLQLAGAAVHAEKIDALGPAAVGIRPNVEETTVRLRLVAQRGALRATRERHETDRRRGEEVAARGVMRVDHQTKLRDVQLPRVPVSPV